MQLIDSVLDSPSVVIIDTFVPSESNLELTLLCSAPSIPPPQIRWYRNSHNILTTGPRFNLLPQGMTKLSLVIPDINIATLGEYSCTASNTHGQSTKQYILRGELPYNGFPRYKQIFSGVPQSPIITTHHERKATNTMQYTLSWSTLTPFPIIEYHLRYRKWSVLTSDNWWNIVVPERKLPQHFIVISEYTLRGIVDKVTYEVKFTFN